MIDQTYAQSLCRMCGHKARTMLSLTPTPLANSYTAKPNQDVTRYPVDLVECLKCAHVQIGHHVPIDFHNYQYATPYATIPHLMEAAQKLRTLYPKAETVFEIGSNNGLYLKELRAVGFTATGIDPNAKDGIGMTFSDALAKTLDPVDIIVANNVLAHVESFHDVFCGIDRLLKEDGVLVFEVQYWPKLVEAGAFDMVYNEHRDYHTITPWTNFLKPFGLVLKRYEHLKTHGGSIRMYCERPGFPCRIPETFYEATDWRAFKAKIAESKRLLLDQISEVNGPVVALGAPAKACTLVHHYGIADLVDRCIDSTPAKHGKYIPGTAIRIDPPDTLPSNTTQTLLLFAWNFEEEFRQQYPNAHFIVPHKEAACPTHST